MPRVLRVPILSTRFGTNKDRLRAACKLKLADAVQAASALAVGADALVTHHRDFSALRDLRVLGVEPEDPPKSAAGFQRR
jgi:predicted nucleic acid-binding protein